MNIPDMQIARRPAVAGYFYPGSAPKLQASLDEMFRATPAASVEGNITGLISPHAGYVFSGSVAASAYQLIRGQAYENVAVIAPSHRDPFGGVTIFPGRYTTPLGSIPTNTELADRLAELTPVIRKSSLGHVDEHALEVQLPFLQYALNEFQLIPLVMGSQDWKTCSALGEALARVLAGTQSLIVASSDLSHYHDQETAHRLDQQIIDAINRYDEKKLYDDILTGTCEACGAGPMIAVMMASRLLGANRAKVIIYRTSGEISKDYEQVVGYLAGVMYS